MLIREGVGELERVRSTGEAEFGQGICTVVVELPKNPR